MLVLCLGAPSSGPSRILTSESVPLPSLQSSAAAPAAETRPQRAALHRQLLLTPLIKTGMHVPGTDGKTAPKPLDGRPHENTGGDRGDRTGVCAGPCAEHIQERPSLALAAPRVGPRFSDTPRHVASSLQPVARHHGSWQ